MAVTVTRVGNRNRQAVSFLVGNFSLVFSGSYPTGGELVDFALLLGLAQKQPFLVSVGGKAGYMYQYDYVAKKVMVRVNTGAGVNLGLPEHTAAAYNAGVTADVVTAVVFVPKAA